MSTDRPRYGPAVATASAATLAVSVFLPWYGFSLTASGTAAFQQQTEKLATQYGNPAFQSEIGRLNAKVGTLAGQQLATLSAHQALKYTSVFVLVLAGIAFVLGLLRLVGSPAPSFAGRESIAGLGILATLCVAFRMLVPPSPLGGEYFSLSLDYGAWLALLSSVGVVLGGLWPRSIAARSAKPRQEGEKVWAQLSGWTPEA
jgi:hypothetical protein